jgi:protocatechuate 3,4-dioxygenase, alpha subunit
MSGQTPSQTVGPFFEYALPFEGGPELVTPGDPDAVRIVGVVYDGAGDPVDDALVELWQANRAGRYRHPEDDRSEVPLESGFTGFGRCPTDADGGWAIRTVKPGASGGQAPHIGVAVFARGLLKHLFTRIYFADEEDANAADPVLAGLDAPARATLVAAREEDGYRFDVRLQGPGETTFFAV